MLALSMFAHVWQVVAPEPGSMVVDMCAAPGGKTVAMAELMRNTGSIAALERSESKVRRCRLDI